MKNNYRKLKFSILLQTVFVTAVTVLVGGFLLNYVIDGIYNDSFARIFVDFLTSLDVEEKTAIDLYWKLIDLPVSRDGPFLTGLNLVPVLSSPVQPRYLLLPSVSIIRNG